GTLEVHDPNSFGGAVRLRRAGESGYTELPPTHPAARGRGTGVADLAYSILRRERAHRAHGRLAAHVVEIMESFERSSVTGQHVTLATTCERPAALPAGLGAHELDP
ncbi:MAG: gfo/Idh/MocA family oxidoreductase, partial [Verrucomicrobiota bacterium]